MLVKCVPGSDVRQQFVHKLTFQYIQDDPGLDGCSCCCLPTPMALASGGSPMFPLVVHQPTYPSIWPAVTPAASVHKSRGDNVVRMWVHFRVQNGSPGSTRFYGPVHLMRYWSIPFQ